MTDAVIFSLTTLLNRFIIDATEGRIRNKWLHGVEGDIYVRYSRRIICEREAMYLDIASISLSHQRRHVFTHILDWLEAIYPNMPIYVENVSRPFLVPFLQRRGYQICEYYEFPDSVVCSLVLLK